MLIAAFRIWWNKTNKVLMKVLWSFLMDQNWILFH